MKNEKDKRGDYIFVGCMFIGMGIGFLTRVLFTPNL